MIRNLKYIIKGYIADIKITRGIKHPYKGDKQLAEENSNPPARIVLKIFMFLLHLLPIPLIFYSIFNRLEEIYKCIFIYTLKEIPLKELSSCFYNSTSKTLDASAADGYNFIALIKDIKKYGIPGLIFVHAGEDKVYRIDDGYHRVAVLKFLYGEDMKIKVLVDER